MRWAAKHPGATRDPRELALAAVALKDRLPAQSEQEQRRTTRSTRS